MSAVSGVVGAIVGSDAQKDAAKTGANAQVQAAQISTDAMLKMWEQSQKDWEPYLDAGYQGISSLQTQMPKYLQETVIPAYNNYMQGLGVAQYDPRAFTVDPVTGQIGGDYTPGDSNALYSVNKGTYQVPSYYQAQATTPRATTQNQFYKQASSPAPTNTSLANLQSQIQMQQNAFTSDAGSNTSGNQANINNAILQYLQGNPTQATTQQKTTDEQAANRLEWDTAVKEKLSADTRTANNTTMQNVLTASASPNALNVNSMSGANYTPTQNASLTQGGVLSPLTPTLEGRVDFNWNESDPIYQYKLKQAQDAARASLAKQGLLDSRAGVNTLSDTAMGVAAEDIDKQYARQVAERDYMTQKAMSEYQMQAQRGDTLYNRLLNQQNSLYSGLQGNQDTALSRLGAAYGLGNALYGQVYNQNLDLSKIGTGAAGSAGQTSMATGQQMGQNALYAGNAQANAAMQAGQANAAMWSGLGGVSGNMAANYMQFAPQQQSYYGGGSGGFYGGSTGYGGGSFMGGMGQGMSSSYTPGAWG